MGRDDFSLCYQPSSSSRQSAFTMVEIALCLAIIGFALVAIIGVMPSGMTVQRDNRIDSLINQDAQFWLNAIRSGGGDVVDLTEHVSTVDGVANVNNNTLTSSQIIGLLSQPFTNNKARVRAIAGSAAERDPSVLGFDYILFTQIYPFTNSPINSPARLATNFLYEVRLTFRWPVLPEATGDNFGNGKKVFRALVSGQLTKSGNLFFFQTKSFEQP